MDLREMWGLIKTQSWNYILALQDVNDNDSCGVFLDTLKNITILSTKIKKN
jgi:hypothetical protein